MKSISARQSGIIVFLTILANKILVLPSAMYEKSKTDSIFALIAIFAFELLVLACFFALKKAYPEQNLKEILSKKMGCVAAKVIIFAFLIFFLFKTMLTYAVLYVYLKDLVYQDEFGFLALVCLFPVVNHAVVCGLRAMGRTFELFYYIVLVGVLFCLCIAFFTNISMPNFFVASPLEIFHSGFRHIFAFGDYLVLFLFIDKIKLKKGEEKKIFLFALVGIILVLAIFIIFYAKYQVTAFMHNNALADLLVFSVQFNAIGRLDIIAMLTIMTLGLFQLEIFQAAFCESFVQIFDKLSVKYGVIVFDILFLVIYLVLIKKYEIMLSFATDYLVYFAILTNIVLPVLIYVLSRRHKKETYDEKND